jgi:BirA family biotin operon repressor/biotin-[acetyl-CoA-carboxylase] ligase
MWWQNDGGQSQGYYFNTKSENSCAAKSNLIQDSFLFNMVVTMILLTDNTEFAQRCIPQSGSPTGNWQPCRVSELPSREAVLAAELFKSSSIMKTEISNGGYWQYLYAVDCAGQSQYDVLSRLSVSGYKLPDRILCCARYGERFHGFKNRNWQASPGNIHLSAFVKPGLKIPGAAVGFIILAVVSALQTIESLGLENANLSVKWVNDILLQGAKVGGVLARLQTQGSITESAVIGIGLNAEQRPEVKRDAHVPAVAAISDFATDPGVCRHANVFPRLIESLGRNLENLYDGRFMDLLEIYRQYSIIIGRRVTICEDTNAADLQVIASGLVESIGPSLELFLRGRPDPVSKGRLVLGEP